MERGRLEDKGGEERLREGEEHERGKNEEEKGKAGRDGEMEGGQRK